MQKERDERMALSRIDAVISGEEEYSFISGNCIDILRTIPDESIECVITSPPYWKQRIYENYDGAMSDIIGAEDTPEEYVNNLVDVFEEIKRILKTDGTFWLNLGDKFIDKCLMGMPWRVALAMQDRGWILRSDIVWDQMKGTQSSKDRFRDIYEHVFQFVKSKKYFFDADAIRIIPDKDAYEKDGRITSATGVTGKKYRKQIQESTVLTEVEKERANIALEETLEEMRKGIVVDFRMTIRGEQRAYHSDNRRISGRAKELEENGYYIIKMRKNGFIPSNIWRIVPEDTWRKDAHCAVFPEELLKRPILSTSRKNGIILDPFSGTGSTVDAAIRMGRRGIGIDLSDQYTTIAINRLQKTMDTLSQMKMDFDG
ncbi:MAG: DNA-methyltransferase [Bacillota bacterium]